MGTTSKNFKITYSALSADMAQIHKEFDQAVADLHAQTKNSALDCTSWVGGKKVESTTCYFKINPANLQQKLFKVHVLPNEKLNDAFKIAKEAQKVWGSMSWQKRVEITRKASDLLRERRIKVAALMSLEVGKNRMESLGDAEEAADLLSYYAQQLEDNHGYERQMGKLSPNENARDTFRPYGVFSVIAPFNFPAALGAGMTSAALLGGNSVILKPSDDAPATSFEIYQAYRDAGLPEGVLQLVYGQGAELGQAMVAHPLCSGVAFTGSKAVGMEILKTTTQGRFARPALMELGGKNAAFVCASANLDDAANGCVKSAFGLTGQKCSALSRVYVHKDVYAEWVKKVVELTQTLKIGDPTLQEIYMGPIINERAVHRHLGAIEEAKKLGKILAGGKDLRSEKQFSQGYFVDPTIVELPRDSRFFKDELFSPFLAVTTFENLEEAIQHANEADYGLTGGIYSSKKEEIDFFFDHYEAGVLYANRKTGATTGAWPGVQPFCGWKGSGGASGRGGCGPYYVQQFMREQSRTIME